MVIALIISYIIAALKQPLVIGYIITGIIVGPAFLGLVKPTDMIDTFGQIGVALLLFIVGLGLKPELIRKVGKAAAVTGIGQIFFTTVFGLLIGVLLGYKLAEASYLALALTFSSTIIVLQLLYSKGEQDTLYGRVAIGFLLVQDLFALLLFLFLNTMVGRQEGLGISLTEMFIRLLIVGLTIYVVSRYLISKVDTTFARSREILFLFGLTTAISLAALFETLGFSFELGALSAGIILSSSPYQREIASRLSSLRDFFLIMFFVVLGAGVSFEVMRASWLAIIIFSAFILVGNPLIVVFLMKRLGYTLETSFFAGLTVAQISEFSLILLGLGVGYGHIEGSLLSLATVVGLITIFFSSYFIMHNRRIYRIAEPYLRKIFGADNVDAKKRKPGNCMVLVFGCHRLGGGVVEELGRASMSFLVVDHSPDVITALNSRTVPCVFGSADDSSFLETLPWRGCRAVITTIPDVETNLALVEYTRRRYPRILILCAANHHYQAKELYAAGATYVIVPPYLGRRYLIDLLRECGLDSARYKAERDLHEQEFLYA